jgi:hypothetical protein
MPSSTHSSSLAKDQTSTPAVHLSYECVVRERGRESASYLYEIACSIAYPTASAYLSMRITGQNTYRNAAAREVPFTRYEAGAITYLELLEEERLEVRIVERDGTYCKAFYSAHGQELSELIARGVVSTIQRIDVGSES